MAGYSGQPTYGVNYDDQNNNQYQAPYTNQYMQPDASAQGHMGTNYNFYAYNNTPAPPFPNPNVVPGVPPLPIFQGWNQDPAPVPSYTVPPNAVQYQGYNQAVQAQTTTGNQYYSPAGPPSYPQTHPTYQSGDVDLSEGEFEDNPLSHTPANYGGSQWAGSSRNGYVDTAQRAVFNRSQDYNAHPPAAGNKSNSHQRRERRQRSGSYSPGGPSQNKPSASGRAQSSFDKPKSPAISSQSNYTAQPQANSSSRNRVNEAYKAAVQDATPSYTPVPASANGKTIPEMKKKAQDAVLNLWPLGVRYQVFLDEGFKVDIISRLYSDLKLSTATKPSSTDINPQSSDTVRSPGLTNAAKQKIEGTNEAVAPATSASTVKSAAMDEKQKTLLTKMEALRKSREERSRKASLTTAKSATTPVPVAEAKSAKPAATTVEKPTHVTASPAVPEPQFVKETSAAQTDAPQPPLTTVKAQLPTPVKSQPQLPTIPGLFLASSTPAPTPVAPPSGINNQRKRPVAADFDDPPAPMAPNPFKRPFGQHRNEQPLIIDVSEDEESEDEDVAMELESQADSPLQPSRNMPAQRSNSNSYGQQFNLNTPAYGSGIPARPQSGQSNSQPKATPEILQKKESEIEALKRKIAEKEAQIKARKTPTGSGQQTPLIIDTAVMASQGAPVVSGSNATSNVDASIQIQDKIEATDQKVAADSQKLADARAAEIANAAELAKKEFEERRLRRQKIASDLPVVEAEVEQTKSKLEELRAAMAKIEADMQQKLEDRRKLAEEMERLGQDAEDQLQAQKDKLADVEQAEAIDQLCSSRATSSDAKSSKQGDEETAPSLAAKNLATPVVHIDEVAMAVEPVKPSAEQASHSIDNAPSSVVEDDHDYSKDSVSTDRALDAQLQDAIQAEADSHADQDDMELEHAYAPNPQQLEPELATSPPEEGQVSEDEGNWSPTLDRAIPDVPARDSEDYEPPDATIPDDMNMVDSPPFSPAPPIPVPDLSEHEMRDIDSIQAADLSGRKSIEDVPSLEDGGFLNEAEVVEKISGPRLFTSYESPLKIFHSYRFHPLFKQTVAGGLRSLTYSNQIDANIEFCPYETAPGFCNDDTCIFQHFKQIKIPDGAIMTAIGSPEEFSGEEYDRFTESLRLLLVGLRVRKIKDFAAIGCEIIAHRNNFLNDPSRILALGDVAL